jgi:predicted ester cyclase
MMRAAFPDLVLDVQDIVAEDDGIALRYTLRGRHDGELMGIPASGERVSSDGMVFARFQDARAVERWGVQDMLTLLQQIGAFPAAEAATG